MGNNPSSKSGDNYPVESISWNDCWKFVVKLNLRYAQGGLLWAMPAEAQWEYACRAGTTGAYAGTGRPDDMGWYASTADCSTHPVGRKQAARRLARMPKPGARGAALGQIDRRLLSKTCSMTAVFLSKM